MPSVYPISRQSEAIYRGVYKTARDFRFAAPATLVAVNENAIIASALRHSALRSLAGIAGRLLPGIGWGIMAYELYDLYRNYNVMEDAASFSYAASLSRNKGWSYTSSGGSLHYPYVDYLGASYGNVGYSGVFPTFSEARLFYSANLASDNAPYEGSLVAHNGAVYQSYFSYYRKIFLTGTPTYYDAYIEGLNDYYVKLVPVGSPAPLVNNLPWQRSSPVYPDPHAPLIATVDPFSVPVSHPLSVPTPIPYHLIPRIFSNPFRYEKYQRQAGYSLPGQLRPIPPYAFPLAARTYGVATTQHAMDKLPLLHYHVRRRPPPGTKERKVRTSGYAAVHFVAGTVTEGLDFINSVYEALPSYYKPKGYVSPQEKLYILYRRWDEIDIVGAVKNLLSEQVEDMLYGELGKQMARASETARPHGAARFGFAIGPAL